MALSLMERGRLEDADRVLASLRDRRRELSPLFQGLALGADAARSLLSGRLVEAEQTAVTLLESVGRAGLIGVAREGHRIILGGVRCSQGRWQDALGLLDEAEPMPTVLCNRAEVLGMLGRLEPARASLAAAIEAGIETPPSHRLLWTTFLAAAVVATESAELADDVYRQLEPYRERALNSPFLFLGCGAHWMGVLALTAGDHDRAETDLRQAAEIHERLGARIYLVRTQLARTRNLLGRRGAGDRERAQLLAEEMVDRSRALGMQLDELWALDLLEQASGG
jgi:tetratricopeptide (TPR) repeat protein